MITQNMLWQILIHTPWWVYLLFVYLLKIGFDATKTRVTSLRRLFILPTVFLALSLNTLLSSFHLSIFPLSTYIIAMFLGISGGWLLARKLNLKFDKHQGLVRIPGNWTTLTLILLIFSAKYYFGYAMAMDPTLSEDTNFELLMLGVSGACAGLFLGRLACYLYLKAQAPHENLKVMG